MARKKWKLPLSDPIEVDELLAAEYPDARCELDYTNPLELLIATVLSAQCTDARVNMTTPALFARYPTAWDYAQADITELEEMVRPTGFYRNKAAALQGIGRMLVAEHDGVVPDTLEELIKLPGVGRKTANVVLGNAFGVPGITVDTHVGRITRRLGWIIETDPVKAEFALQQVLPPERWTMACHRLIFHGRRCCTARKPNCEQCPLAQLCPSFPNGVPPTGVQAQLTQTRKPRKAKP